MENDENDGIIKEIVEKINLGSYEEAKRIMGMYNINVPNDEIYNAVINERDKFLDMGDYTKALEVEKKFGIV